MSRAACNSIEYTIWFQFIYCAQHATAPNNTLQHDYNMISIHILRAACNGIKEFLTISISIHMLCAACNLTGNSNCLTQYAIRISIHILHVVWNKTLCLSNYRHISIHLHSIHRWYRCYLGVRICRPFLSPPDPHLYILNFPSRSVPHYLGLILCGPLLWTPVS